MFSEDFGLIPDSFFTELVLDCLNKGTSSYDLLEGLFSKWHLPHLLEVEDIKKIPYFNDGLLEKIEPLTR